jgi:hypothetical protein
MKTLKHFFLALLEGIQDARKYKRNSSGYAEKAKGSL